MGSFTCNACSSTTALGSGERIGVRDTCSSCHADVHVCLNCEHHDPSAYNECRESSAERVADRDRANRCDYFAIGDPKGGDAANTQQRARSALDDLFTKS